MSPDNAAARLRAVLGGGRVTHAPGVYDAVTAALAREAGFDVAYLSGAAVSAVRLGLPDLGYVTGGDIAGHAAALLPALRGVPLVADADTGYGNALHARRTVEQYARAGIAGLHIEDQASPKRCGHMAGKTLVPLDEAAQRVRAAADAGTGLVVIARTDAASVEGIDAAIARGSAYLQAGADMLFVEGVGTANGLRAVHDALPAAQLVVNRSEAGGSVDAVPPDGDLARLGARLVIHPVSAVLAAAAAARATYRAIREHASAAPVARLSWTELTDLVGLPEALVREAEYAVEAP